VDIIVRDFGVGITDDEMFITVDGGDVGLLRLVTPAKLAKALQLLVTKGICEMDHLVYDAGAA
jgi:hypothetical protein